MLMVLSLEATAPNPSWYNKVVNFLVQWRILFNTISKDIPTRPLITSNLTEPVFQENIYQWNTSGLHEDSRCCRSTPQISCTNSTQYLYTYTKTLPPSVVFPVVPLSHSALPGIYSSPWLSSRSFRNEHKQPYSNHNKVMSVTTKHTHLYNSYHKHRNTHRAGGNKTGSVRINLTLRCVHVTTCHGTLVCL